MEKSGNTDIRYIIQAIDHFTKFRWVHVSNHKASADVIHLLCFIFGHYGPCSILQCDRGGEFVSDELKEFLEKWHVKLIHSGVRHPQTNGSVENANGHLKRLLGK
jgi:transposase InsO family protein